MADFETKKYDVILLGKTLPCLLLSNTLRDCGINFLILDVDAQKSSCKNEANQYLWIDTLNHEVTANMIQFLAPELLEKREHICTNYSVMSDRLGFSWFRGRFYLNCLQFWKTLDCNDMFRKLGTLSEKIDCARNVFEVKWGDLEQELDNVTVLEYLNKNCFLKSTVAWFQELASNFMNCDVAKLSMFWFVWCLKLSGGVETLMNSSQLLIKTETLLTQLEKKLESNIIHSEQRNQCLLLPLKDGLKLRLNNVQMEASLMFSFIDVKRTRSFLKFDDVSCESRNVQVFLEMMFQQPKMNMEVPVMGNISLVKSAASIFCHNDMDRPRSCHRLFASPEFTVFSLRTSFFGKKAIEIYSKCIDQSQAVSYFNSLLFKMYLRVEGTEICASQLHMHPAMPSKGLLSSCLVSESELNPCDRFFILDPLFLTKYPNHTEGMLLTAIQVLRKHFPSFDISKHCGPSGDCTQVAITNKNDDARVCAVDSMKSLCLFHWLCLQKNYTLASCFSSRQ